MDSDTELYKELYTWYHAVHGCSCRNWQSHTKEWYNQCIQYLIAYYFGKDLVDGYVDYDIEDEDEGCRFI